MDVGYTSRVTNKISTIVDVTPSFPNMVMPNIMSTLVFMALVRLITRIQLRVKAQDTAYRNRHQRRPMLKRRQPFWKLHSVITNSFWKQQEKKSFFFKSPWILILIFFNTYLTIKNNYKIKLNSKRDFSCKRLIYNFKY